MPDAQPIRHASMSCLECGYLLVELTDGSPGACPECGQHFDPRDPSTFHRTIDNPERIARLPLAEAIAAVMALEEVGIHAALEREHGGIIGHIDLPRGAVWVARHDVAAARLRLTELARQDDPQEAWTCPQYAEEVDAEFDMCWNCQASRIDHAAP